MSFLHSPIYSCHQDGCRCPGTKLWCQAISTHHPDATLAMMYYEYYYVHIYVYDQVMKVRLSCYLVLLAKPGNKTAAPSCPDPYIYIYIYISCQSHQTNHMFQGGQEASNQSISLSLAGLSSTMFYALTPSSPIPFTPSSPIPFTPHTCIPLCPIPHSP